MPPTRVLVEGASDKAAIETLATRVGRDFEREEVEVVAIGGASRFAEHLIALAGNDVRPVGLCDAGEVDDLRRGLAQVGMNGDDLEAHGFFVCDPDLEAEMIMAVGAEAVIEVVTDQGDLRALRSMQNQPAWRGRAVESQIRRWLGAGSGRKVRYGRLLVEAVELERVPRPLTSLLGSF
jgi:hypothetical protein